ncbi:MAG: helix-turn-helix domain-containing protein [Actinomycetota bacterium]
MDEPTTLGGYLRAARLHRRLSLGRVSEETRIRSDYLMRIESDEFDFLAPAYVRGFLRAYARFLDIPVEPVIAEFDRRFGRVQTDPRQIAELEKRSKKMRPEPRRLNGRWYRWVAGTGAALLLLALIGLVSGAGRPQRPDVASLQSPLPSSTQTTGIAPEAGPHDESQEISLAEGIEVTIVGVRDVCWVDVTADGTNVYTSPGSGLEIGERIGPFTAREAMDIVLGNAYGVDLIINGRRVGPVGGRGEVATIKLPNQINALL